MNAKLIVKTGGQRRVIPLRASPCILGRAKGTTVRIPSAEVSRRHCQLILEHGMMTVEDLDSVNGTFVNGRLLRRPQVVRPGDVIEIGPVSFIVEYELTAAAKKKLYGSGNEVEVLEALADGDEVTSDDGIPMLDSLRDPLGLKADDLDEVQPVSPAQETMDPIAGDLDFESPWQMPDGGDLRDILAQMEDDAPVVPRKPKKKR